MKFRDRLFEKKFAKFMRLLPDYDKRKPKVRVVNGRVVRYHASHYRTPACVKIERLVTMWLRISQGI